jgi:hypothetical protein
VAGAVVGGPVGAVVGGAAGAGGGAAMDEGVDEKIGEARAGESTASGADVLDEMKGRKEFSTFSEAIEATDLKGTFAGEGPVTVFAPTDAAFARLPQGAVDKLTTQQNRAELGWAEQHNALLPTLYGDTMMSYAENHANGTGPFTLVSFAPVSARLLLSIALMGGDGAKPSLVGARAEPAQS